MKTSALGTPSVRLTADRLLPGMSLYAPALLLTGAGEGLESVQACADWERSLSSAVMGFLYGEKGPQRSDELTWSTVPCFERKTSSPCSRVSPRLN